MGAAAALPASVTVEPGREATCPVVVTNTGSVVDQYRIEVVGEAAAWTTAEPAVVGLLPAESATVTLRFAPPRSAGLISGAVPYAVHVSSQEDPLGSVVEEGVVEVGAFTELTVELSPITATAARRARYEVVVDNAGNHPVDVELRGIDREDLLDLRLERTRLTLEPGTAAFVALRVSPRRRFLRGKPVRHPFQVEATFGTGERQAADGTMVQRQLLPPWLVPALITAFILALALVVLWLTVLRPVVRSAARAAAQAEVAEVAEQAQQAEQAAGAAQAAAGAAQQELGTAQEDIKAVAKKAGLDPDNPQADVTTTEEPASDLMDFRIQANSRVVTNPRAFTEFPFTPTDKANEVFLLTDLVLQNPRGHRGTLQILREREDETSVLYEIGLDNFRDHDQHWVAPWRFRAGDQVIVAVSCQNPDATVPCTPAVSFSGRIETGE
ncbi:MAG TPA: hypothetical protein VGD67_06625 [Pseudonocardiaceae bacterium]